MGKKEKEHRKKVTVRNAKLKQQKSAMQKAFDQLLKSQMDKLIEEQNLKVEMSGNNLNFEVVEEKTFDHALSLKPDPEKSKMIENLTIEDREIDINVDMPGEFVEYKEKEKTEK
jgi:hypothetical protein